MERDEGFEACCAHALAGKDARAPGYQLCNSLYITLNGNARLGHLLTRTDPVVVSNVPAPLASTGTRSVVINSAGQSPGSFSTPRDLTLNFRPAAGDQLPEP